MKSKILLIGDDIRYPSGVANVCKNIILNNAEEFDWIQIAVRKKHPESGSIIDVSQSIEKLCNINDVYARLYCTSGYGNEELLFKILENEKPDAILFMTDPRYYKWLFALDNQVRQICPMIYYHVWDNDPLPTFNKKYYDSCDGIACISELTHKLVSELIDTDKIICEYVPHGVALDVFNKLSEKHIAESKYNLLSEGCEFAIFCNNANMRRKQLPLLMESYDKFCSLLKPSQADKTVLMIHTNRVGEGNHDVVKLSEQLYPNRNILFSTAKVEETILNRMYNTFDVTVNTASNEGFGLTTLESLAAGTPIICTNTGGLSSQIVKNNDWGIHIEPSVRKLSGDESTPFIYEDFISSDDVAKALISIYSLNKMDRLGMGKRGREFVEKTFPMERMTNGIANILKSTIKKFKPVNKIKLKKI